MWKKESPPPEPAGNFNRQPETPPPAAAKVDRPEPEARSPGFTALNRSNIRKESASTEPTIVSAQTTLSGEISGQSDVRIYGNFQGTIDIPKNLLIVELSGYAKATIIAKNIQVHGKILGNVTAVDTVQLQSTGDIDGDIRAANVIIDKGSTFNGTIEMVKEQPKASERVDVKPGGAKRKSVAGTPATNQSSAT